MNPHLEKIQGSMDSEDDRIRWVSASVVVESVTKNLKQEWGSSRPRPRHWKMGLTEEKRPRRIL